MAMSMEEELRDKKLIVFGWPSYFVHSLKPKHVCLL